MADQKNSTLDIAANPQHRIPRDFAGHYRQATETIFQDRKSKDKARIYSC